MPGCLFADQDQVLLTAWLVPNVCITTAQIGSGSKQNEIPKPLILKALTLDLNLSRGQNLGQTVALPSPLGRSRRADGDVNRGGSPAVVASSSDPVPDAVPKPVPVPAH